MSLMFARVRPLSPLQKLLHVPWLVLALVAALGCIGVGTLYSVAGGSFEPWAHVHGWRVVAGLCLALGCAFVPFAVWQRLAVPIYVVAFGLLVAVPLVGVEALGARRWLSGGGLSVQPSELMKVALVFVLAAYYQALRPERVSHPFGLIIPLVLIGAPVLLTLRQPDLGSAVLLATIGLGTMFLAGVSLWYFVGGAVAVIASVPLLVPYLHDYQRRRIETFFNPEGDPLGAGYHILQSKIALAAGGMSGQGYLKGTQTQLDFVPEKMTDFIFVAIGEEWGLVGGIALLAIYGLLTILLVALALRARTRFARLMIMGPTLALMAYVVINIGMVSGVVPVVGVPLPLISYGGTSLMTLMWGIGIAMSAHVHRSQTG
jgi:rod shape determining protein RodA